MAREEVACVLIGDGERIAIHAVAGAKLAREVRRPQIVRLARRDRHHAGVAVWPPTRTFVDKSAAREQIGDGAGGRPVADARMPRRLHARRGCDADSDAGCDYGPGVRAVPPRRTARATCTRSGG